MIRRIAVELFENGGGHLATLCCEVLAAIFEELDRDYRRITSGDFESIANEWEAACSSSRVLLLRAGSLPLICDADSLRLESGVHGEASTAKRM